jgi:hypothetical protein
VFTVNSLANLGFPIQKEINKANDKKLPGNYFPFPSTRQKRKEAF